MTPTFKVIVGLHECLMAANPVNVVLGIFDLGIIWLIAVF